MPKRVPNFLNPIKMTGVYRITYNPRFDTNHIPWILDCCFPIIYPMISKILFMLA